MSRLSKIFSVVLIILLLTVFTTPAASAAPEKLGEPELGAVQFLGTPVILIISGISICISEHSFIDICNILGIIWNDVRDTWEQFVSEVTKHINDYVDKEKWVDPTSEKVNEILIDLSLGGDGAGGRRPNGEDDEPYFFEEKIEYEEWKGMVVKIKMKPINMEQAEARVKQGKDVMSIKREWGENLFRKISKENGASESDIERATNDPEHHYKGKKGYYDHLHPLNQPLEKGHPHITLWEKL